MAEARKAMLVGVNQAKGRFYGALTLIYMYQMAYFFNVQYGCNVSMSGSYGVRENCLSQHRER